MSGPILWPGESSTVAELTQSQPQPQEQQQQGQEQQQQPSSPSALMKRMADDLGADFDSRPKRLKSSNMNSQTPKTEPDPDAIKMFVGQIPRSMDENDLRKMFEEFGPVYQLNVLRDKVTGQSKGCCFVTFYTRKSALDAQNMMHNIKTMPGMQHPIQMKPADSEKRNVEERKLFIGMLSKKCTENDVRMIFAPFGTIEECTVLREQNGQSKGCAFITYASRQCALNSIKAMHHSQTMEGCRSPLVVKFADTQKEKEMKKVQQMNTNLFGAAGLSSLGALGPQYLALLQQAAAAGNLGALANLGNLGTDDNKGQMSSLYAPQVNPMAGLNLLQMQQVLAAASAAAAALQTNPGLAALATAISNSNTPTTGTATTTQGDVSNLHSLQNLQSLAALASVAGGSGLNHLGSMQNLATLNQLANAASPTTMNTGSSGTATSGSAMDYQHSSNSIFQLGQTSQATTNTSNSNASMGGLTGLHNSLPNVGAVAPNIGSNGIGNASMAGSNDALSQAYSGIQQYAASFPNAFTTQTTAQLQQAAATSAAGKQSEGPDGANLFIYHLPQEFGDHDLMQMFMPFGTVVSAKVFIDKQTNLSKCFGFVSYGNPVSAQAAIQAMNGFQIGMKRLKVQLKRPKGDSKPY